MPSAPVGLSTSLQGAVSDGDPSARTVTGGGGDAATIAT
jgi:hypothetical protein